VVLQITTRDATHPPNFFLSFHRTLTPHQSYEQIDGAVNVTSKVSTDFPPLPSPCLPPTPPKFVVLSVMRSLAMPIYVQKGFAIESFYFRLLTPVSVIFNSNSMRLTLFACKVHASPPRQSHRRKTCRLSLRSCARFLDIPVILRPTGLMLLVSSSSAPDFTPSAILGGCQHANFPLFPNPTNDHECFFPRALFP